MSPDEVAFVVDGWPPAENEAKSMLAAGHIYADRVLLLLQAAKVATGAHGSPRFGGVAIGLELIVKSPAEPPSDATNYLRGVGDVLEAKGRRGALPHLRELADVARYSNDRQNPSGGLSMGASVRDAILRTGAEVVGRGLLICASAVRHRAANAAGS